MKILFFFLFIKIPIAQLGPTYVQHNIDSIIELNGAYVKNFSNEIVNGRVYMLVNRQRVHLGDIKDGLKVGKWFDWYLNGLKKEEINFVRGKKNGFHKNWDSNGELNYTKFYSDNKKDSLWTFYFKGKKQREESYENNNLVSIKRIFSNGEVMSDGFYLNKEKNNGSFIETRSRIENLKIIKGPARVEYKNGKEETIYWFDKESFNYQNKSSITFSQKCESNKCLSDEKTKARLEILLKYNEEKIKNEIMVSIERERKLKKIAENKKALVRTKNQIDSLLNHSESINNAVLNGINRIVKELEEDSIKNITNKLKVENKLLENKFLIMKRKELQKPILLLDFKSYSFSYRKIDPLGKNILEIILRNKRDIDLQNVNFLVKLIKYENILFKKEYYIKNIKPNETKVQIINPNIQYDKIEVIPFD